MNYCKCCGKIHKSEKILCQSCNGYINFIMKRIKEIDYIPCGINGIMFHNIWLLDKREILRFTEGELSGFMYHSSGITINKAINGKEKGIDCSLEWEMLRKLKNYKKKDLIINKMENSFGFEMENGSRFVIGTQMGNPV